jgi:hypothetical protein
MIEALGSPGTSVLAEPHDITSQKSAFLQWAVSVWYLITTNMRIGM